MRIVNILSKVLMGLLLNMAALPLYAQTDTAAVYNYSCDFEDADENAKWNLLVGKQASQTTNKWYIGQSVNNGGENSLYVSSDGGVNNTYVGEACVIVASRTITLRKTGTDYTLSFDWCANGFSENFIDGLYVAWVPLVDYYGDTVVLESVKNSNIDGTIFNSYCLELNPIGMTVDDRLSLKGTTTWQSCQTTISAGRTGVPYRLVFMWRNSTNVADPPAAIDNIVILDGRACAAPTKLNITTSGSDSLNLSWQGDAGLYEVGCYSYEKNTWSVYTTDTTVYTFTDVPEGFCDFYVRTICYDTLNQENYYSGKIMSNRFIYYPDNHCIDYITLTQSNCFINTQKPSYVTGNYGYVNEMVDYGSASIESRHTHHYSKIETDPRTGGKLKTVPDGEIASVRLGNWKNGGESEKVEFTFLVDSTMPILIMKYAVVLESPGHDIGKPANATNLADPRFTLQVLQNGRSIGDCSSADFTSSGVDEGWTRDTLYAGGSSKINVVWKDWTIVGVNLEEYIGEELTIRLATFDCSQSGHFGYAYFTLGCDKATLDGEQCDGSSITEFRAPSGFDYLWYLADDPNKTPVSTEQILTLTDSTDTREYAVDVIFKEKADCMFTLKASSKPHYPVADFTYRISQRDCRNYITFTNNSRQVQIVRHPDATADTTILKCDSIRWDLGKYTSRIVPTQYQFGELEFPVEGDTFQVTMHAFVSTCEEVLTQTINLPAVGTTYKDTVVEGCKGYPYTMLAQNYDGTPFVGKTYDATGEYQDTLISSIGCDSIIVTHLLLRDSVFTLIDTVILSDQSLLFNDTIRTQSGTFVHHTTNQYGCDSISTLQLYVHEFLSVEMGAVDSICADAGEWLPPFRIKQGRGYKYSVLWKDQQIDGIEQIVLPRGEDAWLTVPIERPILPDIYHASVIFHDSMRIHYPTIIPDDTVEVTLKVHYPDSVLTQRWNDVLAVRNSTYNGGFEFLSYRWYQDGVLLPNDTLSYLYRPEGLDMNAAYSVEVVRPGDSLTLRICPVIPQYVSPEQAPDVPTLVAPGEPLRLPARAGAYREAAWYTSYGALVARKSVNEAMSVVAPNEEGVYILVLTDADGIPFAYKVIVQ